jgi:hypothetical protein
MKRLFLRYFGNQGDKIPRDSTRLSSDVASLREVDKNIKEQAENITLWMAEHPNGKVDFVWLG